MTNSESAAPLPEQAGDAEQPTSRLTIGRILFIALIVGLFAVVWLASYSQLNSLIWDNYFVSHTRLMIPIGVMFFSLLVGLVGKTMHAPNMIEGSPVEAMAAGDTTGYKSFWGALLSSFFSLVSGASVGPEGPLGVLAVYISEWLSVKLKLAKNAFIPASLAGMSSAYNGLIGNPLFAALFASEISGGKGGLPMVASNLAAGAVGYLLFTLLNVPPFAGFLFEGEPVTLNMQMVLWAIILGAIGGAVAVYIGAAMRVVGGLMARFAGRFMLRVLVAGGIVSVVCYFIPNLMFSGEDTIHAIIGNAAQVGIPMLLLMAMLKPLLLAISFKGGFLGGPIFPSLFSATMLALAVGLLFPNVPIEILVACAGAGVTTLVLKAPLTSILLMTVLARADANLMGLIVVAVVAAMILGMGFQRLTEQRKAAQAA